MPIEKNSAGDRIRRDLGDIAALAESMAEMGLLHPVVINTNSRLIAGLRRIRAAQELGWTEIPVNIVDLDAIVRGEFVENACRKDFTPSEAVAIKRVLEPFVELLSPAPRYAELFARSTRPGWDVHGNEVPS